MKVFEYVDYARLMEQIAQGMVKETAHPALPLRILNYTQKAQYTPELWDDVTDKCRGLIYSTVDEEIVARPFVKFWNYGDTRHPETLPENFPAGKPVITRKFDGSLGILYRYADQWAVATRGSFSSDQAIWASYWLVTYGSEFKWPAGWTPLVEIVYPENQIVVKYSWAGLIVLASVNIDTGEEMPLNELQEAASASGLSYVGGFDKAIEDCVAEDTENEEGYVVSWPRPDTWPLRVKIKMETYKRLHRLLTGVNPVDVWELLRDGVGTGSITINVPADFAAWVGRVEAALVVAYSALESAAALAMSEYTGVKLSITPEERKQFALYAVTKQPLTPILFAMLDGKDYASIIWKMVRPKAADTFKVDIDL